MAGYEDLAKKIIAILGPGTDPATLSDDDIQNLVNSDLGFSAKDAKTFIFLRNIRNKNKLKKKLAVPELPADHTLTLPEFQKFKSEGTKVELILPGDSSKVQANAINFDSLEAADWLKVAINCNVLNAHTFKKLGESDDIIFNPLFLPPNISLYNTNNFTVSQESLSYHAESQRFENYSAKSVMTDIGGGISIQSPWVSGSAKYSHQTKHRTVEKDTKVKSMCKIEFPIGTITLPRPSEVNSTSIKLNDGFSKYVNDLLTTPQITKQKFSEDLCKEYGDVVPRNITIGIACYTTKTGETKESQTLDEVSDSFQSSVSAAYDNMGGTLDGHAKKRKTSESGKSTGTASYQFTAIAGSLPDPSNPISIAKYRLEPGSWRAINFGKELIPVISYLSKDVQSKLNNLPGKWPRPTDPIFDNINDTSMYYIEVQKKKNFYIVPKIDVMPDIIPYTILVKEKISSDELVVAFKFNFNGQMIFLAMNWEGVLDTNSDIPTEFVIEKCTDEPDGLVFIKLKQSNSETPQYLEMVDRLFKLSADPQQYILHVKEGEN